MKTAFVLSGGAALGAVQVGMLRALVEHDIVPDLLIGTSSGALNSAYLAGRGVHAEQVRSLADIWRSLRTFELFRPDPLHGVGALIGRNPSLFTNKGTSELISRYINFINIEDAEIPLTVIATELITGEEVAISSGPALEAILASSAIPGVLPPVEWHGRSLIDGGLADDAAISQAVQAGADRVYVLPCGYPCAIDKPPTSAAGILLHAMALLVHKRLVRDIAFYADKVDLIVLPPPCPLSVGSLDFGHADDLIESAYDGAMAHLAIGDGLRPDPADRVGMHDHRSVQ